MSRLARGDIWIVNFDPVVGHEQAGQRPGLIISVDAFNDAGGEDVFVIPITSKQRPVRTRVHVSPPEGGLAQESYIICEMTRSLSSRRLIKRLGQVSERTLQQVEIILAMLLAL